MKKWILAALVAAGMAGAEAQAQGPGPGPGPGGPGMVAGGGAYIEGGYGAQGGGYGGPGGGGGYGYSGVGSKFNGMGKYWAKSFFGGPVLSSSQNLTRMPTLPVYMAAPWYLYWPYDGHFQTVAPPAQSAAFYPPPAYTGNPYLSGRYPGYVPNNPVPEFPMGKK